MVNLRVIREQNKKPMGRTREFLNIADAALSLYKKHFLFFFQISAAFFVIPIFVQKIYEMHMKAPAGFSAFMGQLSSSLSNPYADENPFDTPKTCCILVVAWLLNMLLTCTLSGPVIYATSFLSHGRSIKFLDAFKIGPGKYYRLIMATIGFMMVLTLISWAAGIVLFIPLAIMASSLSPCLIAPGGCVLYLVPSFMISFAAVAMSLYMPAIVLEGAFSRDSVMRSYKLIKGHWWMAFRVIMGILMLQLAVTISSEAAFRLLSGIIISVRPGAEVVAEAFAATGLTVVHVFIKPLIFIAITLLFYELKKRKEGHDLEMLIEAF